VRTTASTGRDRCGSSRPAETAPAPSEAAAVAPAATPALLSSWRRLSGISRVRGRTATAPAGRGSDGSARATPEPRGSASCPSTGANPRRHGAGRVEHRVIKRAAGRAARRARTGRRRSHRIHGGHEQICQPRGQQGGGQQDGTGDQPATTGPDRGSHCGPSFGTWHRTRCRACAIQTDPQRAPRPVRRGQNVRTSVTGRGTCAALAGLEGTPRAVRLRAVVEALGGIWSRPPAAGRRRAAVRPRFSRGSCRRPRWRRTPSCSGGW
jgi:hypothetical protein